MADMKIVFFTNIDAELRQVVADKALPGMNVVTAPADMEMRRARRAPQKGLDEVADLLSGGRNVKPTVQYVTAREY